MPLVKTHLTFLRAPERGGWIALGFEKEALAVFEKHGCLYFLSWSQNWQDPQRFYSGEVCLFSHEKMGVVPGFKPELHPVTIEGPYDMSQMSGGYIPFSPYENDQEAADYAAHHAECRADFPLYMWRAVKK